MRVDVWGADLYPFTLLLLFFSLGVFFADFLNNFLKLMFLF